MEINEKTYILGYWFASDGENNWYMMVKKGKKQWEGQYTFRYHRSDDPHSGEDEKSIYNFTAPLEESEESVIQKIEELFSIIKLKFNDYHDSFLVQGNGLKFMEIAKTKHYLHLKEAPRNQNETI